MVRLLNKELEEKIEEIKNYIENTDSYKNYLKAKELLNTKKDIKDKIEEIKEFQKQLVKNPKEKKKLEEKIKENLDYLDEDITYITYKESLDEVNNMLIILENKLNYYFYEVFH